MNAKQITTRKIVVGLLLLTAVVTGVYVGTTFQRSAIENFQEARDTQPILDLFKDNWYWLVSSPDYSPEFMLHNHAPNQWDRRYFGKLHINVYRLEQKTIGFVAYYMKTAKEGVVLFVAVNKDYRGKRYAEQLLKFALNNLKKMHAQVINLVTRPSNLPAQALYKRVGFVETNRTDEYVFFQYTV